MRNDRLLSLRGLMSAAILTVAAAGLGWLCVESAIVRAVPVTTPELHGIVPHDPGIVLGNAEVALVKQRGILSPETLAAVRRAAQAAPLDARAFVILGHQQLLDRQPTRALATLEAGQRLDPRDGLVHLLLLDRYLRTGRFGNAAAQFAVSSRLLGPAQDAIAKAMAQMSLDPQMRDAVRGTLAADPTLERSVLVTLAGSDTAPSTILALASPAARHDAGGSGSWGPVLVRRLVAGAHYAAARSAWQTLYGFTAAQAAPLVYDAGFRGLPGSPPFNWALTADSLGAADIRDGTLSVNYYGRDSGDLVSQLLVLAPGAYRLAVTVDGSKTGNGPTLAWSLHCATPGKTELTTLAATATGKPHRVAAGFTVPAACPAQQLTLSGEAGEFPAPITLTLRDLDLRPAEAAR